jgi:hypothetical protein
MYNHLKMFKTDAEYQAFKDGSDYVRPNVSYIKKSHVVIFTSEESNKGKYLPYIDTTGFPTEYQVGELYPQVRNIFDEIITMYNLTEPSPDSPVRFAHIYKIEEGWRLDIDGESYDVTNEPLIVNYLSKVSHSDYQIGLTGFSGADIIIDETQLEGSWNSENWENYTFKEDGTYLYQNYWT